MEGNNANILCSLVQTLMSSDISISTAMSILEAASNSNEAYITLYRLGFQYLVKVLPVRTLVSLFKEVRNYNYLGAAEMIVKEFEAYAQGKGSLEEINQLSELLEEFKEDPIIMQNKSQLDQRCSEGRVSVEQNMVYRSENLLNANFTSDSNPKILKIGTIFENGFLDFGGNNRLRATQLKSSYNIIVKDNIAPKPNEICYYHLSYFPKYFGYKIDLDVSSKKCFRNTYFDECDEILQENIDKFHKKSRNEKIQLKDERLEMANTLLLQLTQDLNLFRALNMFHKQVFPENILVYKDKNNPEKYSFKLAGGKCQTYLRHDGTEEVIMDQDLDEYSKKFSAPEKINVIEYKKRFNLNSISFNPNIGDVFSLGVTVLLVITDKNKDKWNDLKFTKTLENLIKSEVSDKKLQNYLLRMIDADYNTRIKLEDLALELGIFND